MLENSTDSNEEKSEESSHDPTSTTDEFLVDNFDLFADQIKGQLQACQRVGEWVEEFGQIEDSYGKNLVKVCY